MYFLSYGGGYLHNPNLSNVMLRDLRMSGPDGQIDNITFEVAKGHPMYDIIQNHDLDNIVALREDHDVIFEGFIDDIQRDIDGTKTITAFSCEKLLKYSIVRPYSTSFINYGTVIPSTINECFAWFIAQHNSQVDSRMQFVVGINEGYLLDDTGLIDISSNSYPTTYDEIYAHFVDELGGHIRIRIEDGYYIIDLLSEWYDYNDQILEFGVNILNYTDSVNTESLVNAVIPIGATMSSTEYGYNQGYTITQDADIIKDKTYFYHGLEGYQEATAINAFGFVRKTKKSSTWSAFVPSDGSVPDNETYDYGYKALNDEGKVVNQQMSELSDFKWYEYHVEYDESELPLTIKGEVTELPSGYSIIDDMIVDNESVAKYGIAAATYSDSELTTKTELIQGGVDYLGAHSSPVSSFTIKAIDMHLINPKIKGIRKGQYVRVVVKPFDIDRYMVCTEISPDITNPGNTEFTFGGSLESLADETNRRLQDLNEHINSSVRKASDLASTALNISNVVKRENTMLDSKIEDKTNATTKVLDYPSLYLAPITYEGFAYKIQNGLAHLAVAIPYSLPKPQLVYTFYTPLVATKNDGSKSCPNILFDLSDCVLSNPCEFCDVSLLHGKQSYISIMETYEYGADYENIPIEETTITRGMRFTLNWNGIPVGELEPYYDINISGTAHATWIDAETREIAKYDTEVNYTYRLYIVSLDDQADWPEFIEMGTLGEPENAENATKEEVEKIVSVQEAIEQVGERVTELEKAPSTQQVFYTTTEESTPFDVYTLLQKPGMVIIESKITIDGVVVIPVKFTYCLYSEEMMAIVTSGIVYFYGNYLVFELIGDLASNTWSQLGPEAISINGHTHEEYITNTDFASNEKAGVIRTSPSSGTKMGSTGVILGTTRTKEQYDSNDNSLIISKGTLENVLGPLIQRIEALEARPTIIVGTIEPDNSQGRTHDIYVQYNEEEQ